MAIKKKDYYKDVLSAYGKPFHVDNFLLIGGLLGLIVVILVYNRPPFYDEPAYMGDIALLHTHGFSKGWLMGLNGSAGPLYSAVQFFFEPITRLQTPFIRLLNTTFLLGVIYFIHLTLRTLHFYGGYAWYIMAIPVTYVVAGLALTEMPAMLFFTAGIYLCVRASRLSSFAGALLHAALSGICMSAAILGRQPYLLTMPAFAFLFLRNKTAGNRLLPAIVFSVFTLALPLYVFSLWRGLVPPGDARIFQALASQGISFRPEYFFLCLAYFAVCLLLIAPAIYRIPSRKELLAGLLLYVLLLAANYFFGLLSYLPMTSVVERLVSAPRLLVLLNNAAGAALLLAGIYFIVTVGRQLMKKHSPVEAAVFFTALLALALACAKITWGFSSRYAAQALPLMVLTGSYYRNTKPNRIPGILAGILLGMVSIILYYAG